MPRGFAIPRRTRRLARLPPADDPNTDPNTDLMPHVILYTRVGCHLCDEAKQTLEQHGLTPQLVDIDNDPTLQQRYNTCVPVVTIDGKERFRGKVSPLLLKRLLQ